MVKKWISYLNAALPILFDFRKSLKYTAKWTCKIFMLQVVLNWNVSLLNTLILPDLNMHQCQKWFLNVDILEVNQKYNNHDIL